MLFSSPLRYSQSWEDHKIIEEALDVNKEKSIVCILSSGDNFLNLLRFEPKALYGFDISSAQANEVKLKLKAIENLDYENFIELIGYKNADRVNIFNSISEKFESETLSFWKKNLQLIRKGIAFQGYTEKKYSFSRKFFRFILGKKFEIFINCNDKQKREEIFNEKINRSYFRFLSKIFTNKLVTQLVYKKELVKNLPRSFDHNKYFWEKQKHIFVDNDIKNNPYLFWYFTGKAPEDQNYWQPYLQKKNYQTIKNNLKNAKVFEKDLYTGLKELDDDCIDAFYFSDIFDWMNFEDMEKILREAIRVARPNAKIIFFVIMHDKSVPKNLEGNLKCDENINSKLLKMDRIGFYTKIYLVNVKK